MRTAPKLSILATALLLAIGPAHATDLMAVYERARASDPQLKSADAQRLAQREALPQARAALLPNIGGTAVLTDTNRDTESFQAFPQPDGSVAFGPVAGNLDTRGRQYSLSLQQSIYNHQNYTRLAGARAQVSQANADYEAALNALFTRVAQAYFDALTAQANLEAAEAQERALSRQLEQVEQRFEVGLTAITDVQEARASADAARAGVILARNALDDAYEALAELTGAPVSGIDKLRDDIPLALPEPADPERWVEVALERSPTIAARRHALEVAEAGIRTAKAGHLPSLGAQVTWSKGANWGFQSFGPNQVPARGANEGPVVSLSLNVPIFQGGLIESQVRQAVAQRDAAQGALEQATRAITRQVRNAYRAVEAGMSEVAARRQALISAQSALKATEAGFEVGTRTIVDVLLSQQQFFAAQREFARARHNFIVAGLALKQAAGVISVADLEGVNALLE
jgi:outer membrane protein